MVDYRARTSTLLLSYDTNNLDRSLFPGEGRFHKQVLHSLSCTVESSASSSTIALLGAADFSDGDAVTDGDDVPGSVFVGPLVLPTSADLTAVSLWPSPISGAITVRTNCLTSFISGNRP